MYAARKAPINANIGALVAKNVNGSDKLDNSNLLLADESLSFFCGGNVKLIVCNESKNISI
jgi:hypothetical protein